MESELLNHIKHLDDEDYILFGTNLVTVGEYREMVEALKDIV